MWVFGLLILLKSGVGKSAVLANWEKRYKQHHPETFVISHYLGIVPSVFKAAARPNPLGEDLAHCLVNSIV